MRILLVSLASVALAFPALSWAESFPGRASGAIDGRAFDFALDCQGWRADERMAFAAGDERNGTDSNGDGRALVFDHVPSLGMTRARLTLDGTQYDIGAGAGSGQGASTWQLDDNSARWQGQARTLAGMVAADVTIDCAPRAAAERGLTGRVRGNFGALAIDRPLGCESWGADVVELATEKAGLPRIEAFYVAAMEGGTVVVTTEERQYQLTAVAIMKTEFEITPDTLRFAHEIRDRPSGEAIAVDLTFDCSGQ